VFQAVVEAGGHLDQAKPDGKTVIALLQEMKKKYFQESLDPRVDHWINTVMPLACYCAQKIHQEHIAFEGDEQQLPLCLQQFIEQHSPRKGKLQGDNLINYYRLFAIIFKNYVIFYLISFNKFKEN
jgi:hypothetical protein